MQKILMAVDGSESSKKAVEKTVEMISKIEAEVTLMTVISDAILRAASIPVSADIPVDYQPEEMMDRINKIIEEEGQKILDEASEILEEEGITPEKIINRGDPAEIICDFAEEEEYDLIVVADRGQSKIKRYLMGSTSDKIVRYARTSVLVVK